MKRIFFPAVLLAILLTGCGSGEAEDVSPDETRIETQPVSETDELPSGTGNAVAVTKIPSENHSTDSAAASTEPTKPTVTGKAAAATVQAAEVSETADDSAAMESASEQEMTGDLTVKLASTEGNVRAELSDNAESSAESTAERTMAVPFTVFETTEEHVAEPTTAALPASVSAATEPSTTASEITWVDTNAYASQVVQLINAERSAQGLNALEVDPELMTYAAVRAQECSVLFSHERPDGSPALVSTTESRLWVFSENCHLGGDPNACFSGWMNSEMHRSSMLSGATHIGVGCYQASDGCIYYTAQFGMAGIY